MDGVYYVDGSVYGSAIGKEFYMNKILLMATAGMAILAASAQAADKPWYFGLEAGLGWVDDDSVRFGGSKIQQEESVSRSIFYNSDRGYELDYNRGLAGFATLGRDFGSFRAEIELGYRGNDLDETYWYYRCEELRSRGYDGKLTELTAMLNLLYDMRLTDRITASVGAGIGLDHAKLEVDYGKWSESDTRNLLAYQGIAGISYALNDSWDVTANYRYLATNDSDFEVGKRSDVLDLNFRKQSATIGLRYRFGSVSAEPITLAAPVASASPAPAQFIIFFGFDKCNLTQAADAVLTEAAAAAKNGASVVTIVGHTDTMGSVTYNQKLSECRASAAKENLVSKGIPASSISTSGRGESQLLIGTDDSVKEPQNRRATVDLSN